MDIIISVFIALLAAWVVLWILERVEGYPCGGKMAILKNILKQIRKRSWDDDD